MAEKTIKSTEDFIKVSEQDDHRGTCIAGDVDVFNGITVRGKHLAGVDSDSFPDLLSESLRIWLSEGKKGIWLKIPTERAELVPAAAKLGFDFHHAKTGYVMMTKWLPTDLPNTLPSYASHYVGVAGFVVSDSNQLLLVQERYLVSLKYRYWKLPGGLADPGEDLGETAVRETLEETGVRTQFVAVLCYRHMHSYRWNCSDLYFVCLLRPLSTDINMDQNEIAACKWMDVKEYISNPDTHPTNRMIAESYMECQRNDIFIQPTPYPHFIQGKPDLVLYTIKPLVRLEQETGGLKQTPAQHKL